MAIVPSKQRKASIIIVVLIIMVVSSFLVLVTMRYFSHMLTGFTSLTNYYKAYYMARGSMDILLTDQSYRGWWYEIEDQSFGKWIQCADCAVTGSITARFPRIDMSKDPVDGKCSIENAIMLSGWQSIIFPLFADQWAKKLTFSSGDSSYSSLGMINNVTMTIYPQNKDRFFGKIYVYDADTQGGSRPFGNIEEHKWFWPTIASISPEMIEWIENQLILTKPPTNTTFTATTIYNQNPQASYYIIITNPGNLDNVEQKVPATPFGICFSKGDTSIENVPMIWLNTILRADAHVADSYVTLETIKTNRFPSFLVQ